MEAALSSQEVGFPSTSPWGVQVPGTTISPCERRKKTIISSVIPDDRPAWAGFAGEHQMRGLAVEPSNELFNVGLPAPERSDECRWIAAVRLGMRDGDEVLVDVQTDEKGSRLGHG
jgi:hypothetical protein